MNDIFSLNGKLIHPKGNFSSVLVGYTFKFSFHLTY